MCYRIVFGFFFFKQKTAYEMRISDWSSDVCSSDLAAISTSLATSSLKVQNRQRQIPTRLMVSSRLRESVARWRSEEHTSELQSLMRISYAVFCLKKKNLKQTRTHDNHQQTKSQHINTNVNERNNHTTTSNITHQQQIVTDT